MDYKESIVIEYNRWAQVWRDSANDHAQSILATFMLNAIYNQAKSYGGALWKYFRKNTGD